MLTALRGIVGFLVIASILGTARAAQTQAPPGKLRAYVGTYTGHGSQGIYLIQVDAATGRVESLGLAAELANPSFLALHPTQPLLYAVGEVSGFAGKPSGAVRRWPSIRPAEN